MVKLSNGIIDEKKKQQDIYEDMLIMITYFQLGEIGET